MESGDPRGSAQDSFESTDWEVLCNSLGEDINSMTYCITENIKLCEYTTLPAKTVRCFPNNKPSPEGEDLPVKRQVGNEENKLKLESRAEKGQGLLQEEDGAKLHQNNTRDVWTLMREIIDFNLKDKQLEQSE